jgi:hypothetical protein
MKCSNNLKQISLSCHNFESAHGVLPPGMMGPFTAIPNPVSGGFTYVPNDLGPFTFEAQHNGVLTWLLPYVEQENLYRAIDTTYYDVATKGQFWDIKNGNDSKWYNSSINMELARTRISIFECPSDDPYESTTGTFIAFYIGDCTFTGGYFANGPARYGEAIGRSNYTGNYGGFGVRPTSGACASWNRYKGPFGNRTAYKLNVKDGTSQTIFFGETLSGAATPGATRTFSHSWFGSGVKPTVWSIPNNADWYQYSSRHTSIVQFGYGDGSVRSVRHLSTSGPDWTEFIDSSGHIDGQTVDWTLLGQ